MQTSGTKRKVLSVATMALMALAVVPLLASSASASAVSPSVVAPSAEWAFGGEGWDSGHFGPITWNASAGAVVIFSATNTSSTTTELQANRTVAVSVSVAYAAPGTSWKYDLKAVETDHAYANVTTAASVTLANLSVVPALGVLNASLHANASLRASLVGVVGNLSASDYLNVSGWATSQVAFTPALGLVPLNLSGVTSWASIANASGSAAWNVTWGYTNHGWNGTSATYSGDLNGTWSTTTEVVLVGHVAGPFAHWVDHKLRTAIAVALSGPFDLYAGVLLVPHAFDLFGSASHPYAAAGVGGTSVTSEYLFVTNGARYLTAQSVSAANLTAGAAAPTSIASVAPGVTPAASSGSPTPTVWEQPESPSAAQSQAHCLQFGCTSSSNPLGHLLLPLALVGVAAVVAIGLILSRRSRHRGGPAMDQTLSAQPGVGPTPPPGVDPPGSVRPPQ